ncbi:pantothenate kinase type III CoaA-like protein [Psychroflexus torquis ATCC 700755]|uniref:Type III pantothenate kinase n=1 Tax=Psychroflexus torquis (strain ATCC 700755 / CIP 106069 / ACAM 623) TaxID=313595 RepID=K4IGY7_PSYTT|nr:type III pantothenate kinase [Psychroflexus torquis]AFU69033.1 pantothenate kinase type III CoaA-like protein [Psychroflexus torquis ATCC 700755]
MNLAIDIGNTLVKLAIFDQDQLLESSSSSSENVLTHVNALIEAYPKLSNGIISSTAQVPKDLKNKLTSQLNLVEFTHESKVNFKNNYTTPETLGLDRIALVVAASEIYPNANVLVIDAGTCITYDFLDKTNTYQGGAISPGLQMRFKAMHTFTEKLPLITKSCQNTYFIGKSTHEAMRIGVFKSVCYEIDGYIEDYLADYEDLTVVLTGGDYYLLSASIKNSIFATSNFLLKGLNKILQLNSN